MNPVLWMAHPLSGDIPANIARAKRWLRWLCRMYTHLDFAADWILWCEVLDDADPAERERGLLFDESMIRRLDGFCMVGGKISTGMSRERFMAYKHGKPAVDLTFLGEEPPTRLSFEQHTQIHRLWQEARLA